uniref:Malonyl-CoA decarboxylase n=1 Tax=Candidatus Kentrum sp. FM TaxID=2126340 RepID=A0A450SUR4_9GAMM|nr:MAG: malonyl-CoA decarboxylase [Candidatus Kentron sp. FM]VFJ59350.1 MAG: malonyl-CoA decarboxylase [Candidatus Kentron sp. FM]VFK06314.1 MAG: malonyl-CoA decarboxylase [Candidatus Kentron sp. FM]
MSSNHSKFSKATDRTIGSGSGFTETKRAGGIEVSPSLSGDDWISVKAEIDKCLYGRGSEVSERARAMDLGRLYLDLDAQGRKRFFQLLATRYDIDRTALARTVAAWNELYQRPEHREESIDRLHRATEETLREKLTPPRIRLLARFNGLPEGVKFLVDMRSELIPLARKDPALKGLDDDLKTLLAGWFDVGFLDLQCITWDAPASLLEKLVRYEAVHAVTSWHDIKNRLAPPDRRCYAYFHPKMPNEPLIFVWVALVKGMSGNVQTLLDTKGRSIQDPLDADTAIFYSISNAQAGLAGISLGNFLIKRVVKDLVNSYKHIKTFATLSPIPGFRGWLAEQIAEEGDSLLSADELQAISSVAGKSRDEDTRGARLLSVLCARKGWNQQPDIVQVLEGPLLRLCARYLTRAKRGKYARNRVAHFHLSNGARMERINWLGDISRKGIEDSAGMMINYLYESDEIEKNHEAYTNDGKIAVSSYINGLLI